jgi:hypothetical protein
VESLKDDIDDLNIFMKNKEFAADIEAKEEVQLPLLSVKPLRVGF